jgi:hypothetical protein
VFGELELKLANSGGDDLGLCVELVLGLRVVSILFRQPSVEGIVEGGVVVGVVGQVTGQAGELHISGVDHHNEPQPNGQAIQVYQS